MSAPLVAISVVGWNTCDATLRCLDALYASTYANYRVVLVDNASRDDSAAQQGAAGETLVFASGQGPSVALFLR